MRKLLIILIGFTVGSACKLNYLTIYTFSVSCDARAGSKSETLISILDHNGKGTNNLIRVSNPLIGHGTTYFECSGGYTSTTQKLAECGTTGNNHDCSDPAWLANNGGVTYNDDAHLIIKQCLPYDRGCEK